MNRSPDIFFGIGLPDLSEIIKQRERREKYKKCREKYKKSLTTKQIASSITTIEKETNMDAKAFISDFERHVKNLTEDNSNWNGDGRKIADYDKSVLKDLEDYLSSGRQNIYADRNFARETAKLFADDDYMVEEYLSDIESEIPKLWKEHGGNKAKDRSDNMSNSGDNKGLMTRVFDTAIDDGTEIATRLAAKQLSRAVAEPVTAMLIAGLGLEDNDSVRGKIGKFLASDVGLGLVSFALSFGVKSLPLPALAQGVVENLGRELRLQGEMAVADPIVEMVGAPMRAMLTEKVLALPAFAGLEKQLMPAKVVDASGIEVKEKSTKKTDKKTAAPKKSKATKKNNLDIKVVVKDGPTVKTNEAKT